VKLSISCRHTLLWKIKFGAIYVEKLNRMLNSCQHLKKSPKRLLSIYNWKGDIPHQTPIFANTAVFPTTLVDFTIYKYRHAYAQKIGCHDNSLHRRATLSFIVHPLPVISLHIPTNDRTAINLRKAHQIQDGSNMTGTNCDLFTHKSSRSYLNHLVQRCYTKNLRCSDTVQFAGSIDKSLTLL
jgi:hypothetical protein